ncbi:DUF2752 domain-containing protein [Nocardiopsis sp. EMB25]|uniref:DUF2752 domain-containing protein n=1 Tax=Nocardiopsis sp. EMB25 TaxID=2835867 RepID=UPI0022834EC1|nr:DUF2752 domain-containing protein [Nocardiopsis sp. EMB25]MCY9783410.1 DUF2752 domain-containing protein [Nocardiopsis sp. EMB25]
MPQWAKPIAVRVEDRDRHRWTFWLAVAGLALGAAMAVFGLPPVSIHGPFHFFGIMDPFCGGTRSVWLAVKGDLALSWAYNPVGIPLVAGAVLTVPRILFGFATGRWVNVYVTRVMPLWIVGGTLFALLGVRQQLNVDLLRDPGEEFSFLGVFLNTLPVLVAAAWIVVQRRRITAGPRPARA